jgi:hypothetical protein
MPVEFDIRPVVQKESAMPYERLRVVQQLAQFDLAAIRRGVVFVFAIWSGPAVTGLRRFTRQLSMLDLGPLDVIVLDNDSMTGEDMTRLFGHVFHGAGEAVWVRDGHVVAELSACRPESEPLILRHTRELLA